MIKKRILICAVVAVFGFTISLDSASAQCTSCDSGGSNFSFPTVSPIVGGGHLGANRLGNNRLGNGQLKYQFEQQQAINQKIAARNAAWPKPFTCADRQLYHNVWNPMINAGWEDQCILTETHFDPETGELTRYGVQQIGGMMMNMPQNRRVVFVQECVNGEQTEQRVAKVRDVVSTYYSQRGGVVQVSTRTPATQNGPYAERISILAGESTPNPIIPIASGTSSVQESGR